MPKASHEIFMGGFLTFQLVKFGKTAIIQAVWRGK